jgi:hypothetical protein
MKNKGGEFCVEAVVSAATIARDTRATTANKNIQLLAAK